MKPLVQYTELARARVQYTYIHEDDEFDVKVLAEYAGAAATPDAFFVKLDVTLEGEKGDYNQRVPVRVIKQELGGTDGTMIGTCGFHRWDEKHRRAEIGYDLQAAYWRQGYASEATRAMMAFCFKELNLHRLEADCNEGNKGSAAVLEKCGFKYEGVAQSYLQINGRWRTHVLYASLRRDRRGRTATG